MRGGSDLVIGRRTTANGTSINLRLVGVQPEIQGGAIPRPVESRIPVARREAVVVGGRKDDRPGRV
jgi:hypothetical protein